MRLKRDSSTKPVCLEIKAEYLKDYLSARKAGIVLSRYHERTKVSNNLNDFDLQEGKSAEKKEKRYLWKINCIAATQGTGEPYGSEWACVHISRTDVDYNEDIPEYGIPANDNVSVQNKNIKTKRE